MRIIAFRDILRPEPVGVKNGKELGKTTCMRREMPEMRAIYAGKGPQASIRL